MVMARNHVSRNVPLRPVAKQRLKLMPADAWLGRMGILMESHRHSVCNVTPGLINHGLLIRGGTPPRVISSNTFLWYPPKKKQPFGVY